MHRLQGLSKPTEKRAHLQDQVLATLRDRVADIISGTVFLFIGFLACGVAAMRRLLWVWCRTAFRPVFHIWTLLPRI